MNFSEDKLTVKAWRFNETEDDDFLHWCLRMKAALRGERMASALTNDNVSADTSDKALSMITFSLEYSPLGAVQDCVTAKDAWDNIRARYTSKTVVNKLGVLNAC